MALNRLHDGSAGNLEEGCINASNRLIGMCNLPFPQVTSLKDLNWNFFIKLFQKVTSMAVPDLILPPKAIEDEAHNVQAVIDTLSLDLLSISLSHITGEDVVAGNLRAISNLLEVLEGCLVYVADFLRPSLAGPARRSRVEKLGPRNENHRSKVCILCGYDPELDRKKDDDDAESAREASFSVCPVCLHRNSASDSYCSGKSSELQEGTLDSFEQLQEGPLSDETSASHIIHVRLPESGKHQEKVADVVCDGFKKRQDVEHASIDIDGIPVAAERLGSEAHGPSPTFLTPAPPAAATTIKPEPDSKKNEKQCQSKKSKSLDDLHEVSSVLKLDKVAQTSDSLVQKRDEQTQKGAVTRRKVRRRPAPILHADEEDIAVLHEKNMLKRITTFLDETDYRRRATQIKKAYHQSMRKPYKRKSISPVCRKSYLLPYTLRPRKSRSSPKRGRRRSTSRSSTRSPGRNGHQNAFPEEEEETLIKELMQEFPGVSLSPSTLRRMKRKYENHLLTMHKKLKDSLLRKSQTQIQNQEVCKRQKILTGLIKKEAQQSQHMNELDEMKSLDRKMKTTERDAKIESARMKHYYEEFYEEMKKRLQKRNYSEEQLVKSLFDEALNMQKDQVNELRKQLRERQEKDSIDYKIYLDAVENFYQTQLSMLAKSLAVEKHDIEVRSKAQQRVLEKMKRDYRAQMETEIRKMQENILRNNEDIHFREMDAERVRENLRDRFSARL